MTYKLDFLEEALAEWNKLNPSIKQPLKKKLIKVLENPRIPKKGEFQQHTHLIW